MVLEPDLHLGRGQVDHGGQVFPLGGGQVFLLLEASFQLVDLQRNHDNCLKLGGQVGPTAIDGEG